MVLIEIKHCIDRAEYKVVFIALMILNIASYILCVKNDIGKSYQFIRSANENFVLQGTEAAYIPFESGKIYGIYGKNGSGKTMLLRAIAGFINTDKGYIKYNHKALHKDMDVLPDLGAVIENISFWSMYSGFENLKMLSNIKGIVSDEEIYEIMIYFGLDPKSKKKVNKYSLGMRQKLALCQALMEHPKILLLDEPTNALDQHF